MSHCEYPFPYQCSILGDSEKKKAAIVLSASVTLLSLPGLDGLARVAGLVAILFSSFSVVSTVLAIFKYKSDLEKSGVSSSSGNVGVGGEGLVVLSVCLFCCYYFIAHRLIKTNFFYYYFSAGVWSCHFRLSFLFMRL